MVFMFSMLLRGEALAGDTPAQLVPPTTDAAAPAQAPAVEVSTVIPAGAPTIAIQDLIAAARQYTDENAAGLSAEEKKKRLEVKNRISAILDLREMAHLILIKQWDKLKPAEREKYASLMAALVEKIGYPQIEKFFNEKLDVSYEEEKPLDGGATAVSTKIAYKEEDVTFSTEFRLHPTDKGWRIYDVITDGESLLLIYRNQHAGIIKDKGFPHLIKLMEKKLK
jgi:phospholipid transport system substrate-binding protein